MQPETLFAAAPEGQVAYQVFGEGPLDVLFVPPWLWNIEIMWEEPRIERFMARLGSFSRVIVFDKRGTGVSDPVPLGVLPTLEQWTDDIPVVLDAAGSNRAAIIASDEGVQMALVFAAAHPERSTALVSIDGAACYLRRDDYPAGLPVELVDAAVNVMTGPERGDWTALRTPSLMEDQQYRRWFARFMRLSVSPSSMARMFRNGMDWDVRAVLSAIRVPTLILHHAENRYMRIAHARYLADHIRDARLAELPGADDGFWAGDQDVILDEIQAFLTGNRGSPEHDRVLATVLFTDIVASTERAAKLGDRRWHEVLDAHDRFATEQVTRYRGRLIKTTGDGVLATFDGPARAIRCTTAIAEAVRRLGIEVRSGLHTGEVELRGQDVGGMAVNLAARVMAEARPNEILVSSTVKDLVIGSGIEFDDRGSHALKGVPGEWRLYAVVGGLQDQLFRSGAGR
jgi:class 3 adenylate cyclase